jgi:methylated-DNA-[protein]-cysteine S-methyltransferase
LKQLLFCIIVLGIRLDLKVILNIKYFSINTRLGWIVIGGSENGLQFSTLPQPTRRAALARVHYLKIGAIEDPAAFEDLPLRLQSYFEGDPVDFSDRLDLERATSFQQAVWSAARCISYGEVKSYSWVAKQVGKPQAYRAVGGAMARNPLPIIVPCHRVVAHDGGLGGFSGGLELKKRLLDLEAGLADG